MLFTYVAQLLTRRANHSSHNAHGPRPRRHALRRRNFGSFQSLEERRLLAVAYEDDSWRAADGGAQDIVTGLVWTCRESVSSAGFVFANTFSQNLVEGGFDDWRLPTLTELNEAFQHGVLNHLVNADHPRSHWSSTPGKKGTHWGLAGRLGGDTLFNDNSAIGFLSVRGAPDPAVFTEPKVRVFSHEIRTRENQSPNYFRVALDTAPTANVTVSITSTDTTEGTVSISQLVFTPQNWNVVQAVEVRVVSDQTADGNVAYTIELGSAVSGDPNYNGLDVHDVTVTNSDVDVAGIVLANPGSEPLLTTEAGGTAAVSVLLATKPADGPVYVSLLSSDASEGSSLGASLVFEASNWNVAQTGYISGVADGVADGDVLYSIQAVADAGSSSEYMGVVSGSLGLTNTDQDGTLRTYSSGSINRSIPDNGSTTSQINVSGTELIGDLDVSISIAHPNVGDLRITLIGPNGQSFVLADRRGGSGDNFTGTIFDDEAALPITSASAPFIGTLRPQAGALADWDDASAAGTWTLRVEDLVRRNTGRLVDWSLSVREKAAPLPPPPPSGTLASSSVALDAMAVQALFATDAESATFKPRRTPKSV